tara:strand:+ start:542 stop:1402 length:861 start_codon:yes stop_codon:yes gene_type:complete
MSENAVAVKSSGFGLISREDLAKSLNNFTASMPSVGGDKQYLKMLSKGRDSGTWVYGQGNTEVEEGSLWALDPMSIKHGYVAWDSNAGGPPVQEIMVPSTRLPPPIESLPVLPMSAPDKKTGRSEQLVYDKQASIDAVCISGEDKGVVVEYKQSSGGAIKLFQKLAGLISAQMDKGDDIVPVGKWHFSTYDHPIKAYGEIYNPEFEIVEWRTPDDTSPAEETKPEPVKEEPKRKRGNSMSSAEADAKAPVRDTFPDDDDTVAEDLGKEYAEAEAAAEATPRRRQRR